MTDLWAPYNFAPLAPYVFAPRWARAVSQDRPFADGYCGSLTLDIEATAPLVVGGGRETRRQRDGWNCVHPVRGPDGRPFIPGSSLKGMIRNVVEIASFGRFAHFVDDRRMGVRDLTARFYTDLITRPTGKGGHGALVHAGWLYYDERGKNWRIQPADYARVDFSVLQTAGAIAFNDRTTIAQKYTMLENADLLECGFPSQDNFVGNYPHQRGKVQLAYVKATCLVRGKDARGRDDLIRGTVVCTGPISSKHMEFVFHSWDGRKAIDVPRAVYQGFKRIHEERRRDDTSETPWQYWMGRLDRGEVGPGARLGRIVPGIPVFYMSTKTDGGDVKALGLAQMFKIPYDFSVHDMARHTSAGHAPRGNESRPYDLAELLFGTIREDGADNLRGRVSFGHARMTFGSHQEAAHPALVLNSPKPTFYPAYVEQKASTTDRAAGDTVGAYDTYMNKSGGAAPRLRGWKRYLPRPKVEATPQADPRTQKKVALELHALPAGVKFQTRLDVHNLLPEEIGALLYAIELGDDDKRAQRVHGLGLGKAYGFGAVRISVVAVDLTPNKMAKDAGSAASQVNALATFREAWRNTMASFLKEHGEQRDYATHPTIAALLELADTQSKTAKALRSERTPYMPLPNFQNGKKVRRALPSAAAGSTKPGKDAAAPAPNRDNLVFPSFLTVPPRGGAGAIPARAGAGGDRVLATRGKPRFVKIDGRATNVLARNDITAAMAERGDIVEVTDMASGNTLKVSAALFR